MTKDSMARDSGGEGMTKFIITCTISLIRVTLVNDDVTIHFPPRPFPSRIKQSGKQRRLLESSLIKLENQ